ncbi:MAG TPA: GDYXXLXY domain-containing protein [Candidatus Acidoferrum sp.]|nr:GDYXXLXY domain-containing protein [Candidatus Acidoferrum sp.]
MKLKLLVLVLALQSAWLLGTVAVQEHALATGQVILLETERVDPRDLLQGDYLILHYKISDVPTNLFSPPVGKSLPEDIKICVALAPTTNRFYVVVKASTNDFAPAADEVLLKGKSAGYQWPHTNAVHVEYGLERFYVAEGTGNPVGKLTAQVVVPASGRGRVKEVFVDGKPYAEAMRDTTR